MPWAPGVGVGPTLVDMILLAVKVYNDCKAAPQEFRGLARQVKNLHDTLKGVEAEYQSLDVENPRDIEWGDDLESIVSLRQHGRLSQDVKNLDKKLDAVPEAVVDSLVDAVDLLALRARTGSPEDNTLVDSMNDTNRIWENFRRELEAGGFTSQTIMNNKEPIMEHIKEFITYDMLESEAEVSSHAEPDSIEWISSRASKPKKPKLPQDFIEPASDADSEMTILPLPSRTKRAGHRQASKPQALQNSQVIILDESRPSRPWLDASGPSGSDSKKDPRWLYRRSTNIPSGLGAASRIYSYELLEAAAAGSLEIVRQLLYAGCNIESASIMLGHHLFGTTALYRAVSESHFEVARYLLENGANVDAFVVQKYGVTKPALFVAIENHDVEMTRLLLEYDAHLTNIEDSISALQVVIDQNDDVVLLELILAYSAHAADDRVNNSGETALHLAAWRNNFAFLKRLLKKGARPNILCQNGQSALYRAASNGNIYMLRDLLDHGADPKLGKVRMRERALKKAKAQGSLDVFNELLSAGAGEGTIYI
ncbi:Ankyrin-1 [Xylographa pallens]|nr:Ankyrin-1 [Xylographa pallens]